MKHLAILSFHNLQACTTLSLITWHLTLCFMATDHLSHDLWPCCTSNPSCDMITWMSHDHYSSVCHMTSTNHSFTTYHHTIGLLSTTWHVITLDVNLQPATFSHMTTDPITWPVTSRTTCSLWSHDHCLFLRWLYPDTCPKLICI